MRSQNDRYERWLGGAFVDVDVDGARIDPQYRRPECRFFVVFVFVAPSPVLISRK